MSALGLTALAPVAVQSINHIKKPSAVTIQTESSQALKFVLVDESSPLPGIDYGNASKEEIAYCNRWRFWHAGECSFAEEASKWAIQLSSEKFPADWKGDPSHVNAYRHMLWSALMTWGLGEDTARGFLDRHEQGDHDPKNNADRCADPLNNETGIRIGKSRELGVAWAPDLRTAQSLIATEVGRLIDAGIYARREDFRNDTIDRCVSSSIVSLGSQ